MGRRALAAITLSLSVFAAAGPARGQSEGAPDSERYALRAEVGLEYDSNAHRTEIIAGANNPPLVASPLERLVLTGTLADVIADGQAITLMATAAGKIFDAPAATDEDLAIAQSSLAWQKVLGSSSRLTLAGAYYEAFQAQAANLIDASERRDFRSLAPTLQLDWEAARIDGTLTLGYRQFLFKPDRDEDFEAPTAGIELRWARDRDAEADWEAGAGAEVEDRTFGGPALVSSCPDGIPTGFACSGPDTRHDQFLMSHVEVTRTGRALAGLGYTFHDNRSNSYGETVMRHFVTARFATALPAGLTIAARAELLFAFYSQPIVIGQIAAGNSFSSVESIDDENRSSVRVDLSRELGAGLRFVARYTFYANELANAAPISYRRQTLLLSLTGVLEK